MVDDASPDGTQEVAKQLAKVYGEDHVVGLTYRGRALSTVHISFPGPETKSGQAGIGVSLRIHLSRWQLT